MTSTTTITNVAAPRVSPVVVASAQSATETAPATTTVSVEAKTGFSQRIINDPSAGVILQYLDGKGSVESQLPSTTAVAYRRAGLAADGTVPKTIPPETQA
jgi:hypothetical protein